jgi:chromosome segregation ATPase
VGEVAAIVSAGGGGALLAGFVYVLYALRQDRKDYQDAIDRAEARADAAEQRTREAYARLDEARKARHAAEDELQRLRRGPS